MDLTPEANSANDFLIAEIEDGLRRYIHAGVESTVPSQEAVDAKAQPEA